MYMYSFEYGSYEESNSVTLLNFIQYNQEEFEHLVHHSARQAIKQISNLPNRHRMNSYTVEDLFHHIKDNLIEMFGFIEPKYEAKFSSFAWHKTTIVTGDRFSNVCDEMGDKLANNTTDIRFELSDIFGRSGDDLRDIL